MTIRKLYELPRLNGSKKQVWMDLGTIKKVEEKSKDSIQLCRIRTTDSGKVFEYLDNSNFTKDDISFIIRYFLLRKQWAE